FCLSFFLFCFFPFEFNFFLRLVLQLFSLPFFWVLFLHSNFVFEGLTPLFFLDFKSVSSESISFSNVCFLNFVVSRCSRSEPFFPRSKSKPSFCICSGSLSCNHNNS